MSAGTDSKLAGRRRRAHLSVRVFGLVLVALVGFAGPAWAATFAEVADAGDTLATANVPKGTGSLDTITGALGPIDADVYKICVTGAFSAFVGDAGEGSPEVDDPTLYLFDASGNGIVMNDDVGGDPYESGALITPTLTPGTYYLAISGYDMDPHDSADNEIFPDAPFTSQNPPNAGVGPLDHWDRADVGNLGSYTITLTGVQLWTPGRASGDRNHCHSGPPGRQR